MFKLIQKLGALLVLLYLKEAERKLDASAKMAKYAQDTTATAVTMLAAADAAVESSREAHAESVSLVNKAKQLEGFFK